MVKIDEIYFERVMTAIILVALVISAFLILRPILLSIIFGFLLAFIFIPVYDRINKKIKSGNFSAFIMMVLLLFIIFLPIWFLIPMLIEQSFKIFQSVLQIDFVTPLKHIFPRFFVSEQFSTQISSVISSFITRTSNSITNSFTNFLLNLPTVVMQVVVVLFTFFFVLRDREHVANYIRSLLPFPKEIEKKLFEYSSEITKSVLYGTVIVGIIQGAIVGIGFFVFGISNALFLTLLTMIAGILPIVGTAVVWIPVVIFMLIAGNNVAAWGVLFFGLFSTVIEHLLRPLFVSKRTKMHSAIVLISMVGGAFYFGILGFIIGPLIVSYLLIILEIYRKKPIPGLMTIQEPGKK